MKRQKPFFKNTFKNLIKNKIQLIAIIILVFITSFIYTISYTSSSRINDSYQTFISEQNSNLHDFVIDLSESSYINDYDLDEFKTISNVEVRNNLILTYLQNKLINTDDEFIFDRIEARSFSLSSNKNLKVFALNPEQQVDKVIVSEGMDINLWKQYTLASNDFTRRWVYVNEQFAKANKIKINDVIRLQDDIYGTTIKVKDSEIQKVDTSIFDAMDINYIIDKTEYSSQNWFQVVGYATSSEFSTPIVDVSKPLPNTKDEGLVYINPLNFGMKYSYLDSIASSDPNVNKITSSLSNTSKIRIWYTNGSISTNENLKVTSDIDKEIYFVGKFKNDVDIKIATVNINDYITNFKVATKIGLNSIFINTINPEKNLATYLGSSEYTYAQRTLLLQKVIFAYQVFSNIIIAVVMSIGVVMLIVLLNNQIKKSFSQTGVLMALGYKTSTLIWSNSLFPLFITFTGGLLGFLVGLSLQDIVVKIINQYFSIVMKPFVFSWESMLVVLFSIFILLETITLIVYSIKLNTHSPLQMINYENRNATNKFKLTIKKIFTHRKTFNARFQGAMLASSISKLLAVFNVILVSTCLLTIGSLLTLVLQENKTKMYSGNEFDNLIEYNSPIYNSPLSFYKTYDPNSVIKNIDEGISSEELINMYVENNISSKTYEASEDLSTLNNMTYKTIGLDFLQNKNLTIGDGTTFINDNYYKAAALNLWEDLVLFGLDTYWDKEQIISLLTNDALAVEKVEDLEKIRLFYLKYKDTVGINDKYWREDYFKSSLLIWNGVGENPYLNIEDGDEFNKIVSLRINGTINTNINLNESLYDFVSDSPSVYRSKRIQLINLVYNWFVGIFKNNLQQAFLQGIYSSSPWLVRSQIDQEFEKTNPNFTIGFNLIPFSNKTDDIGIYLNGVLKNYELKIYGLNEEQKNQKLFDEKNNDLTSKLFEKSNAIVINKTLAKRLKLKVGDKINVNHILNALSYENEILEIESWDSSSLSASDSEGFTNSKNLYKSSLLDSQVNNNDWFNSKISSTSGIYQSTMSPTSQNQTNPNQMSQAVNTGQVLIEAEIKNFDYEIVGIHNQYGDNKAWVSNDLAKKISNYDETENILFEVFKKEWMNPKNKSNKNLEFIEKMNSDINFSKFKTWTQSSEENQIYLKLFQAQYPIFNYKTSSDESFADLSKGVSTTQAYGDFSMYGLNGGVDANDQVYAGYSMSSIQNALKIDEAILVLSRINLTINAIVYFVLTIAVILSAVIILLIINLVIAQNSHIIAAIKILGYKESYIAKLFIGTYIPIVLIASVLGFIIGWFILSFGISSMIQTIVLPFTFQWWFIIPSILGSWVLYAISVSMSWTSLKRISPLIAIQGG